MYVTKMIENKREANRNQKCGLSKRYATSFIAQLRES